MLTLVEDDPTAPEVPLDDLIAIAEEYSRESEVPLDDLIAFVDEDSTEPQVPLDDLIAYYTVRYKFYHQSSDAATLSLLVKTRLIQQALWELDTAGATALFMKFHNLPVC